MGEASLPIDILGNSLHFDALVANVEFMEW